MTTLRLSGVGGMGAALLNPAAAPAAVGGSDPCVVPLGTSQGLDLSSPAENEVFYGGPDSQKTSIRENLVFLRIKWASRAKTCDFT